MEKADVWSLSEDFAAEKASRHFETLDKLLFSKEFTLLEERQLAAEVEKKALKHKLLLSDIVKKDFNEAFESQLSVINKEVDALRDCLYREVSQLKEKAMQKLMEKYENKLMGLIRSNSLQFPLEEEQTTGYHKTGSGVHTISPMKKQPATPKKGGIYEDEIDVEEGEYFRHFANNHITKRKASEAFDEERQNKRWNLQQQIDESMKEAVSRALVDIKRQLKEEYDDQLEEEKEKITLMLELKYAEKERQEGEPAVDFA